MKTLKRITAVRALPIVALAIVLMSRSECSAADESGISFFEQKIRPILVQHCYGCHSVEAMEVKKLQGALYLDSAAGVAAGGESGAVVVTGKSADSLLMKALRYDGLEMPPSGKLPDEVIADFAKWIDLGAPDPREGSVPVKPKREINLDEGRKWWAFQPLQAVKLPNAANSIDGFISIAQQSQGLKPGVPAGKEALLRRAYFDLIGLPPTPEQMAAYIADTSPRAFEKVVDELLASPAYGERWARHWLDAARFAESGGYEFDRFRPGAYHYRDWVIRALNSDMAYDQFVQMQLAGDLINPDSIEGAAATGFLVAGPYPGQITAKTVERIRYDQLDDMMMTIGGSMLGLTLGCARCHEHKYDPIPHQDYYALAAAMATTAHGPRPLDPDPDATTRAQEKHNADQQPLLNALNTFAATELPTRFTAWQEKELSKQPAVTRWQTMEPVDLEGERSYLKESPGGLIVHDGMLTPGSIVRQRGQNRKVRSDEVYRLTFHTYQKNLQSLRLDAFTDGSLPARGPGLNGDGGFQLSEITVTARPLDLQSKDVSKNLKLKPLFAAFEDKDQPLSNAVDGSSETAWIVKATAKKDNAAIFELEEPLAGFDGGTELVVELTFRELGMGRLRFAFSVDPNPATWAGEVTTQHASELRAIVATHGKELPDSMRVPLARWLAPFDPPTGKVFYAVRDHRAATPRPNLQEVYTTVSGGQDVFFLRRGEVDNKAGKAEPGFLQVMWQKNEDPAVTDSPAAHPRVAMAKWMTDVENGAGALLARVIVNRLWQHHLGQGIVGTPNDFGVQGDRPTHPELLEHLAQELVRQGWKLKPLHRAIMLSHVYQQSHVIHPDNLKIDSANRYWWHFPPRRLEAETIRDALLAAGGSGDPLMFGASVLDDSQRRSVYLRVKRSELLPIMTIFDAPEPTQSIGKRSVTTVPTQALAMMNSPLVRQQAEKLTARIRPSADQPLSTSIVLAYQIAFGRSPSESEQVRMTAFIEEQRAAIGPDSPESTEKALTEFCHVLFCLNEFVYID